jgi:hypothetical protein
VETIVCSRLRKGPALDPYQRRLMRLPDGGTLALDFEDYESPQDLPRDAPVVILLPGHPSHNNQYNNKHIIIQYIKSGRKLKIHNR